MQDGSDLKIQKRIFLISNLENIIRESVYYRNHSHEFLASGRIDIPIFEEKIVVKKVI
jgi:hypothetical protein